MRISKEQHYHLFESLVPNVTYIFELAPIPVNDTILLNTTHNLVNVILKSQTDALMDFTVRLRISKLLSKIVNMDVVHDGKASPLVFPKDNRSTISYLQPMIIAIVIASLAIFIIILLILYILCRIFKDKETNTYWLNEQ